MVGLGAKDKGNPAPIVPGLKIKGDTIAGRYRVEKLLGAGSSGFVVAARHVYLRRRVTLKILTSTTNAYGRAQRRHLAVAHRAAALRGPHIARIVDTGFTEDGTPFVATERLEGRTLAQELAARTRLPAVSAVRWILQACEGLAEAHSAGIVHADLKPQNLFLAGDPTSSTADGHCEDARVLKILDFGMATPVEEGGDESAAAWFASPAYLAPEQIRDPHAIDARVDIWALGVILHELISGTLPFSSDTVSGMLVAVACDEPALLAAEDVPFELARVVQACLAKDPAARPADVVTLARALAPFAGAEGSALARRVEAALSTPPPMAMTIEPNANAPDDASETMAGIESSRPRAQRPPLARAAEPPAAAALARGDDLALEKDDRAFHRRRAGAIAIVGAAAVLALVGLLAPPQAAAEPKVPSDAVELPPPPAIPEGAALPFIPPSFLTSEEPDATNDAPPSPPPKPAGPPPPPPSQRPEPAASAAAKALAKDLPPNKPRSSLAVRDNPYNRGFTHPTRLSDRSSK